MATTVHLPPDLLDVVDKHARDLGVSRNKFIVQALRQAIQERAAWSPGFVNELTLAADDTEGQNLVDEMTRAIAANRTRKAPPEL